MSLVDVSGRGYYDAVVQPFVMRDRSRISCSRGEVRELAIDLLPDAQRCRVEVDSAKSENGRHRCRLVGHPAVVSSDARDCFASVMGVR